TFPNSIYRLTVTRDGQARPVARTVFHSLWIEMPTSLLNLDVAIDMLKFIVSKEEIKRIKSGSQAVREQKFREFWESKDPTPKTEYNELMAEYYRRIDYAYEHFTTINTIGYESDQGEIYIKYGPPKNIERKFPTGEPAVEIWTYENRQFVFRATSGFGDFRLVSR
ncbi:MAG: GWxTD domain-containing protein, partial [Balneolaceae bacterium]|nr:GWxTD domain-containing protein [Balneolaceae bacterium]